jgi:hypothetical protein
MLRILLGIGLVFAVLFAGRLIVFFLRGSPGRRGERA